MDCNLIYVGMNSFIIAPRLNDGLDLELLSGSQCMMYVFGLSWGVSHSDCLELNESNWSFVFLSIIPVDFGEIQMAIQFIWINHHDDHNLA